MEQLKHRGFWTELEHPVIGGLKYPGIPVKIDDPDALPSGPAPRSGEHTLAILKELGISSEEIKNLWQLAVI
jgi:crotonobetainyl-CoA:carnitine CoA-transferase CaiB-like acyl-CoA transferase